MVRRGLAFAIGVLAVVLWTSSAGALFHLAVIDEVLTSYSGDANSQFIEIRMLASLQSFVSHSILAAFDSNGNYIGDILEVPSDLANSGAGVRWLVATSQWQTASGVTADFTMPAGILPTAGGMVCFGGGGGVAPLNPPTWSRTTFTNYVDCVAYGTYAGSTNTLIGTPTTVNGDGHSLQRTTSTQNNAADFTCGDPITPQNNAGASASIAATVPCGACPGAQDPACLDTFAKGMLLIKEAAGKEALLAKLIGGPALTQTGLGNPLSGGGTAYAVCIYDGSGARVAELAVDRAGDTCGSAPCWKALGGDPPGGKGYKYKDDALAADGVFQILYKGGLAGKSKALIKGRGAGLPDNVADALLASSSATVQLRGSDAAQCLSITVTDIKKQEADFFKAKK
jgi:hypothetical protein